MYVNYNRKVINTFTKYVLVGFNMCYVDDITF